MILQVAGGGGGGGEAPRWQDEIQSLLTVSRSINPGTLFLDLLLYPAINLSVVKPSLDQDFWGLELRLETVTVEISGSDARQLGGDHDSSWCVWRATETMFSHLLVYLWVDINICVCGWVQWYTWTTEFSYSFTLSWIKPVLSPHSIQQIS